MTNTPVSTTTYLSPATIATPHPVEIVRGTEEKLILSDLQRRIAERAYELSEAAGFSPGKDMEHWLKAERETLNRITTIRESGSWVILNLHVPNMTPDGFNLFVGEKKALVQIEDPFVAHSHAETRNSRTASYYLAEWPAPVDPKTAAAYIKNGMLTLEVKLATAKPEAVMQAKAGLSK